MSIVLVKCINYKELEDLTKYLLRAFKMMSAPVRYNRRKNEIVVDGTKFRFVTVQQNIDGIRYNRVMNAYDFYKDGDKNGKINPDYQKNKIQLFTKNIDKGYIFKAKCRLSNETLNNIQKKLLEQLKSGIVIYPEETLELVDIYSFEIHEIVDSTEDKIII